jgi:DNA-binding CsgD family transcriptional regulator/tetratricopeptide (TPR) repeat protein
VTEAFLGAGRHSERPSGEELHGFEGQLARLVPGWGSIEPGRVDESPLLIAETALRLLRALAGERGCLMVLEDLQWSDAETISVVEYLAENVGGERVLCVVTTRTEAPVTAPLLERVPRAAAADVIPLSALTRDQQQQMLRACLGVDDLSPALASFILTHSDGVPFLIEELLAGVVAAGALVRSPTGWRAVGTLTPSAPASLVESVRRRVAALGPDGRQVLGAAAILGRRFDWDLVPGTAGTDGAAVVDALRAALAEQLVTVDGQEFRFRHALTREIVLSDLLPPERVELARRALDAVRLAHPGLPGPFCELAADLAENAGNSTEAAKLLLESARRAMGRGAFRTASGAAERAVGLTEPGAELWVDAHEVLVQVLAQSGDVAHALDAGAAVLEQMDRMGRARRAADLRMLLAEASIAAGDNPRAQRLLDAARRTSFTGREQDEFAARLDALAAHVALDAEDPATAEFLAEKAVTQARAVVLPEVECSALEVLGRVRWTRDIDASIGLLDRSIAIAEANGLGYWRLRALQQSALLRSTSEGATALHEARALAGAAGALTMAAHLDLILAELAFSELDAAGCERSAIACIDTSRRFGLASLPVALMWLAGAHALRGDKSRMEAVLAEALACDPDDQRIPTDSWGRIRATYFAVREDRDGLRHALDTSIRLMATAPAGRSLYFGRVLHAILHTLEDDDFGDQVRKELAAAEFMALPPGPIASHIAAAIALGRRGQPDEASREFAQARRIIQQIGPAFGTHLVDQRLAAEAAIRDGWGEPVVWLRELEAKFTELGLERLARTCRTLLAQAGAPARRRGRGESVVPARLRALGVTSRELDVLKLVVDGLSNREIAARLYLSPRTVENHVATLLRRTGTDSRARLAGYAID